MKLKRFVAYLVDITLVGFIASVLSSISLLNPYYDNYLDANDSFNEIIEGIDEDNITYIFTSDSFINGYQNVIKYSSFSTVISLGCYLLYFVGFQKWNKGQTLGKKLMNIKVISNKDNSSVSVLDYVLRTIILYNLFFTSLNVLFVFIFSGKLFFTISLVTSIIGYVITYVGYAFVIFRKDEKGLHDLVSGTSVVEVKNVIS